MQRSRELRARASQAESKLWYRLRRKQVGGLRFRRQFPLGPYFADFVCLPARIVIEVDGDRHGEEEQRAHDVRRTQWLERNRFRVIRFWARDVMNNIESVIDAIELLMGPLPYALRACPLPQGEGEDVTVIER